MAIQGLQEINVGLPNESAGSDSLFNAFTKTKDNFTNLFANASPTPLAGNGIAISNIANAITVSANLVAGNNIILTNANGAIVIDSLSVNGGSNGIIPGAITLLYSALPSATTTGAGSRAFITDSNLVAAGNFGALVSGSGANNVPVYSDGTNWRIG